MCPVVPDKSALSSISVLQGLREVLGAGDSLSGSTGQMCTEWHECVVVGPYEVVEPCDNVSGSTGQLCHRRCGAE